MPNRVAIASVCLHLSAVIYVALGLLFFVLSRSPEYAEEVSPGLGQAMLAFCVCIALGIEVVALGLRRRRFWAWIAGLCIFALFVPSPFLPLGVLGLWGLLAQGSRAAFGIQAGVNAA